MVWFLWCFGLKTGVDFAHFGLEKGMVFEKTTGVTNVLVFSIPNELERKSYMQILNGFKEIFLLVV